ncbi:multidrug effflux MFS transporter [Aquibaculum sediminis]|uniref:multidrug effflux MFS transporter n=1 Tax=Aquibaculum sediminis TaxID=3231907 RepID=UPI003452E4FE
MTAAAEATPPTAIDRPKPPIAILVAVSAIGPFALNIFVPSIPGLARFYEVDYGTIQLTFTLYLVGLAVSQLFYGPLSDRFGRRPLLLGGMALFVVASVICALAPPLEYLIIARILQAVGGCSGLVLSRAIVRDLYGRDKAASVIGYITMAWVAAPMMAPSIGGLLDVHFGWQASFYLVAAAGLAALLAAMRWLHETNHHRSSDSGGVAMILGFGRLLKSPRYLGYALPTAFTSAVFFSFLAGAPYLTIEVLGLTPFGYGLWFILVSFGYFLGNFASGRYSQRLGVDRMILTGTLLALVGVGLIATFALGGLLSPWTLFMPMFLVSLGNGMSIANGLAGSVSVYPAMAGAASGLAGFLQMGLGAGSAQLVGLVQEHWTDFMAVINLGWAVLALSVFLLLVRPTRRRPHSAEQS